MVLSCKYALHFFKTKKYGLAEGHSAVGEIIVYETTN